MKRSTHIVVQVILTLIQVGNFASGAAGPKWEPVIMAAVTLLQAALGIFNHGFTPQGTKIAAMVLLVLGLCGGAFAQTAAPAIPVSTFTLNASPISLPGIGTTVAGSDSGFKFQATTNFALREDNITASGFQFYGGGFNYTLASLSNKLNNVSPNLDGLQFSFYVTGSAGIDRITSLPVTAQHYAFMGGGGFLYRLSPSSAWATGIEVKYAKFPGYNPNTFVVSVPIAFSF